MSVKVNVTTNSASVKINPKRKVFVNQISSSQKNRLVDLVDVDATDLQNGSLLIYNDTNSKFETSKTLESQVINGGNF